MEISMNEWAFTQGMIGYRRILQYYDVDVPTTSDGIVVTKEHLQLLPEAYFQYFLDKYSVAKRHEALLWSWHAKWRKGDKKFKKELNSRLKDIETKVGKYFTDNEAGERILENIKLYRAEKDYSEKLDKYVEEIIHDVKTKEIDEKLTCNTFKAVYLSPYFGQVSFLNVTKNASSVEEQKSIFKQDFIQPVLDEWEFLRYLDEENKEACLDFLQDSPHKLLTSLKTPFKKKDSEAMKQYINEKILKCSLTDFPLGLYSFEESIFSPLALSIKNSLNSTWNSEGKNFFPISAIAKLILFCAPAGATINNKKSIFVQFDGTFEEIYHANEHYNTESDRDTSFDEVVFDLVREQKLRSNWKRDNYVILEYESDYSSKKTILDYMILTPNLIKLFQNHDKLLDYLNYYNKVPFIKLLLKNIDTKVFTFNLLREKIKNEYSSLEVMFMTLLRHYNQFYLKEAAYQMDSEKQQSYIWVLYKSAGNVRSKIGLKKAQGIAYRLLNAVQAGNKNTFMDTVMRVYVSSEIEMPSLLLEALHENKMDFETVANAWVAGLISKPNEEGVAKNE
ncbi:Cas8a1 family CRISPR/Cas system-associated protein [Virgibacillus oceani]